MKHEIHNGKNTAYHIKWEFRREAAVWTNDKPIRPNFYPFATELKEWLSGKLLIENSLVEGDGRYSNVYTYQASTLHEIYKLCINESASFIKSTAKDVPRDLELTRIRLYTDLVSYTARICETLIKQLLYCTDFPQNQYQGAALGALLKARCRSCVEVKEKPHNLSLLGSLAHRYKLCHVYEKCLREHIEFANNRRNLESAHSGVNPFRIRTVEAIRAKHDNDSQKVASEFRHMLDHISDLEMEMNKELQGYILEILSPGPTETDSL